MPHPDGTYCRVVPAVELQAHLAPAEPERLGWVRAAVTRTLSVALASILSSTGLAQSAQSTADTVPASIRGLVRDSLGIPVSGASVLLSPAGAITRTDSSGRFQVRNAPVGAVTITIRKLGFSPLQSRVNIPVGNELVLDLVMRRLPQMLAEVEVTAERKRQCPRYSLEGILCRREGAGGEFMNRQEIQATKAVFPMLALRDMPGLRQNLNGNPRTIESTVGWRCIATLIDGRPPGPTNPSPRRIQEMFAVELYHQPDIPPEYQQWAWRSATPCSLLAIWTMRVGRQAVRPPR